MEEIGDSRHSSSVKGVKTKTFNVNPGASGKFDLRERQTVTKM